MVRCKSKSRGEPDLVRSISTLFFFSAFVLANGTKNDTLVPAIITFGDSSVDVGNNNHLHTLMRADFFPYGRDFLNHTPTGRFCNGKLATDFTAELLGFKTYAPPYLSPKARGKNLLKGINFASGGSGYDHKTAIKAKAAILSLQLEYYKQYQFKLIKVAGSKRAASIINNALYIVSFGNSDFVQNYYINPLLHIHGADWYSDLLIRNFEGFIKDLYRLGARRIGVTSLTAIGCLPTMITLFGFGNSGCVSRINSDAQTYNKKLTSSANCLQKELQGLKIAILDVYTPLFELVNNPSKHGFAEVRRGCCGTGLIETSILCHSKSIGTCSNATQYVFWDGFHPSEAANKFIAASQVAQGLSLVS